MDKLVNRLAKDVDDVEKIFSATSIPAYAAMPAPNMLDNLLPECEDSAFWYNFKKAAPILFCTAIEDI